ncbi:hypothetical protein [Cystobacter ferrugineus]|uniref:Glycosyltransferase RgtA/B/C/D-like domain-containing protein n=1 Tax=Cystobacter ferrugineus TaxID=83449 RepID=A0A1L9BGG6_9BACT|nr:hypothetical protein [Cystobacter ferrugineus]OJH41339.1 hypothetical protein BON30_10750 [Cystobacter ferrugineus]
MIRRESLLQVLLVGLWVLVVTRVLSLMPPGACWVGWNSDMAIPVLQINDAVINPFRFYYYGQDRLGAWPWMLMQAARPLSGGGWTVHALILWHTLWTCAACFALLRLHRWGGWVLAAAYAALLMVLPGQNVEHMFALGHAFGWQTTAMLVSWWALARMLEALAGPTPVASGARRWGAGAALFAALACWSSPTSGPMLLAFLSVWGLFVAFQGPAGRARWRLLWSVLPVGVGIVTEVILRNRYHHFARKHFGQRYGTNIQMDLGYLGENTHAILERLRTAAPGPWVLVGWGLGLVALAFLVGQARRRTLDTRSDLARLAALTLMFTAGSVANALLTVLVTHVRLNGYEARYLVPTFVFGCLALAMGVLFLLSWVPALRAHMKGLGALLASGLLLGGYVFAREPMPRDPLLEQAYVVANALVEREPGHVLLGGYWDSYLVGALDPLGRIPTVVFKGEYLRTPFWTRDLREGPGAWVVFRREGEEARTATAPPWLIQYGTVLRLAEAHAVLAPPFQVARYVNETRHTVPVRLAPERGFKPCEAGASVTVHFERPVERGLLLVASRTPPEGIEVEAPGADEARLEANLGAWRVHLKGSRPIDQVTLRVRARVESEFCDFYGAALVTGAALDAAPP